MSIVKELIRVEKTGELSFGNYELSEKAKVDAFKNKGDVYKVKTCKDITKLEKNGLFVYESVPGTTVIGFIQDENGIKCTIEGSEDAEVTLELEDKQSYAININGDDAGVMETNLGGKITVSVELGEDKEASLIVNKN